MLVQEIMTAKVEAVKAEVTIEEAFQRMYEGDFRHLPVISGSGELIGILSDRDLRSQIMPALTEVEDPEARDAILATSVADLMHSDPISVVPEDEVTDVIELMLEHRIGAVPVVDPHTGALLGIVSYVDVLRAAQDLF